MRYPILYKYKDEVINFNRKQYGYMLRSQDKDLGKNIRSRGVYLPLTKSCM